MALVLSPWFGRGCGRRTRPFSFGSPSLFTDLVIIKVPQMQRQACAPVQGRSPAISNARVVQWAETADSHVFKLSLPGLKKEDLHIQVEEDRTLYISYSNQPNDEAKEGEAAIDSSQSKDSKKPGSFSFMRKFKLPENADLEQIKAEVINETLTVTVPKLKMKPAEARRIKVSEGATSEATSSTTPTHEGKAAEKSVRFSTPEAAKASTSTA